MDVLRVHWTGLASGVPSGDRTARPTPRTRSWSSHWPLITPNSVVLVSASECKPYDYTVPSFTARIPERYVGDAPVVVKNVAPQDGRVEIVVSIGWGDPLNVVTDIVVIDAPEVVVEAGTGVMTSADLPSAVAAAVSNMPKKQLETLREELAGEAGPKGKVRTSVKVRRAAARQARSRRRGRQPRHQLPLGLVDVRRLRVDDEAADGAPSSPATCSWRRASSTRLPYAFLPKSRLCA